MEFTGHKTRPRRQNLAITLFVAQLLTALAAVFASWIEVESILVTGPLLAVFGLALAVAVRPLGTWTPLLFGLSGPLVSAIVAFTIAAFHLAPLHAVGPVVAIVAIYLIVILPVAAVAYGQIHQWPARLSQRQPRVWRYSLKTLIGLMTVVAILSAALAGLAKTLYDFPPAFAAFGSVVIVLSGIVLRRSVIHRRQMMHPSTSAFEPSGDTQNRVDEDRPSVSSKVILPKID